jgi:hypothetical protein
LVKRSVFLKQEKIMPTEVITSIEQVGQNFSGNFSVRNQNHPDGGSITPKFHWLLLMIVAIAYTSSAQTYSGQRPKPTINRPRVVAELDTTRQTILQKCAEVDPDASYLIPKADQFGGQTEASGSGAYAYKPPGNCPYWVVDFLMNRSSNTWVDEFGNTKRENVRFYGNTFDLPSSKDANLNHTRPIVEEDCKRLELDVFIYRKDPNENTFKIIKSGKNRFSWDNTNKTCNMQGLLEEHSERAPTANMLKIRIAVRVKLRGSWQQAAGYAAVTPPS